MTIDLSGCGTTKGCFREPSDCTGADCIAVVTWTPRTDDAQTYIEFELQGRDNWVALGLSADTLMVGALTVANVSLPNAAAACFGRFL